jgi:hypothetical protein
MMVLVILAAVLMMVMIMVMRMGAESPSQILTAIREEKDH